MTINYKIKFLSDWHTGSGLDSGTETNALVLKDKDGLPYIPGKTIKGLLRDALKDMEEVGQCTMTTIDTLFGKSEEGESITGKAFFSNANLPEAQQLEITSNQLKEYLYRNIASTAIGDNGVALPHSLRVTQVCIPVELVGAISNLDTSDQTTFEHALKWLRHLGVNRNRGLGRCKFSII